MAQGDGQRIIRNAPFRITFIAISSDEQVTGLTITASDVSLDGGTFTDITDSPTENASTGVYVIDLTAAEFTGDEIAVLMDHASMNTWFKVFEPEPALDSGVATAGGASSITLPATAVGTTDYYNGATIEIVRGTGGGQTRSIIDYTSGRLVTVDRPWIVVPDTTSVYKITSPIAPKLTTAIRAATDVEAISGSTTAADKLKAITRGITTSSIDDGSPSTTVFIGASGLEAVVNNFYDNALITFIDGPNAGITRKITNYDETTLTFTVAAFPTTPTNGDLFHVISDSS